MDASLLENPFRGELDMMVMTDNELFVVTSHKIFKTKIATLSLKILTSLKSFDVK